MRKLISHTALCAMAVLSAVSAGCRMGPAETGTFDRTLTVTGSVQLELHNGSGHVEIRSGQAGQVRIRGDFSMWTMIWENNHTQGQELSAHPPIEQQGNVIRVGYQDTNTIHASIDYTIYVPTDTEVRAQNGSGSLEVSDIKGPAVLHTGSGRVTGRQIHSDTDAQTGSGSIDLTDVSGRATAVTGSGSITITRISGDIRASTGSGSINMDQTSARINAHTGSGSIEIGGAADDVRASTGSGSVRIQGNPAPSSFWEVRAGSGGISLDVPSNANFRVHARSRSGSISFDIPVSIEEQISRHEMRGRIGNGGGSVDLDTGSGSIRIR